MSEDATPERIAVVWSPEARTNLRATLLHFVSNLAFQNPPNIPLSVENADYLDRVILQEVINADRFESGHRPGSQISKLRIAEPILRANPRMLT